MSIEVKIQRNVSLAPYTSFQIGGPAKFFVEVKTKEDLEKSVAWAKKNKEEIYILGGGSNILISDKGLDGLVIKFSNNNVDDMSPRLECGAGAFLSYIITVARSKGLTGLEWGFGIPRATLGGCVRGNAGAFGTQMQDIVETVEVFDLKKGKFDSYSNADCKFIYRGSIFKYNPDVLIWSAILKLKKADAKDIREKVDEYMKYRDDRQPRLPSAGSVFKNLFLEDIKKQNEKLYNYIIENKATKGGKVGAGYLLDLHGLKGKKMNGAKVSLEHANFIVNTGGATAQDVLDLMRYIAGEIKIRFNIELEPEIQLIGFDEE